jgi:hypothetical protein
MSTINVSNLKNPNSTSNNIVLAADGSTTIATLSSTTFTGTDLNATNLKNPSSTSNNIVLNTNGSTAITTLSSTTLTSTDITGTTIQGTIKSGTSVASTSGTSIDFTGIPSWVKRVTVMFSGVSTNGTSDLLIQLGDSGGFETTGYTSSSMAGAATVINADSTAGFIIQSASTAAFVLSGNMIINLLSGNSWVQSHVVDRSDTPAIRVGGGSKTLSATLDRVRITTVNGTDTFDAGSINILYEG